MAGTAQGGKKAAQTNKTRYGNDFYNTIGAKGGKISRGGGFATTPGLASRAGRIGGLASKRGKNVSKTTEDDQTPVIQES